MKVIDTIIHQLRLQLEAIADSEKASQMQGYMKDKFVYHGVQAPQRNAVQKTWFNDVKKAKADLWELADALWDMEQREYQYVAIDLLKKQPKKDIQKADINALEHLITTKSWWDTVDSLASNSVGVYFSKFPEERDAVIEKWRNSDDMWLNRTCIIFQLKYKEKTDFGLLKDVIKQYQMVNEFFIQKAIGWSLRQHSKFAPEAVRSFVEEINLTGLAYREATKYI